MANANPTGNVTVNPAKPVGATPAAPVTAVVEGATAQVTRYCEGVVTLPSGLTITNN